MSGPRGQKGEKVALHQLFLKFHMRNYVHALACRESKVLGA